MQTGDDDVVIDTFQVTDIDGSPSLPEWKRERVVTSTRQVLEGEVTMDTLFDKHGTQRRTGRGLPQREPAVQIENQVSDRYTVIDVEASNHVGLLYTLTHSLGGQALDIHMAIINTVADRASDAFYVVDEEGQKIVSFDRLDTIRAHLLDALRPSA